MDMDRRSQVIRDLSESGSFAGRRIGDVLRDAYDQGHAAGVELALAARPMPPDDQWNWPVAGQARVVTASTPPGVPGAFAAAVREVAPPAGAPNPAIGERLHETLVAVVSRIVDEQYNTGSIGPTPPWHLFREATYRSLPAASTPTEVVDLAFSNADGGVTVTAGIIAGDLLLSTDYAVLEDIAKHRILCAVAQLDASGRRRDGMSLIGPGAEIAELAGPPPILTPEQVEHVRKEEERFLAELAAGVMPSLNGFESSSGAPAPDAGPAPTLTPAQVDEIVAAAEPVTAEIIPPGELAEAMAPVSVEDPLGSAQDAPVGDPTDVQIRDGEGTGEVPVTDPPITEDDLPFPSATPETIEPLPGPAGDEITEEGELVLDDDAPPAEETP